MSFRELNLARAKFNLHIHKKLERFHALFECIFWGARHSELLGNNVCSLIHRIVSGGEVVVCVCVCAWVGASDLLSVQIVL